MENPAASKRYLTIIRTYDRLGVATWNLSVKSTMLEALDHIMEDLIYTESLYRDEDREDVYLIRDFLCTGKLCVGRYGENWRRAPSTWRTSPPSSSSSTRWARSSRSSACSPAPARSRRRWMPRARARSSTRRC